ncbi:GNAT family N-acetyltransferase [Anaeromyxobacter oryzae]|uniref:GNAT family N-acetyltransferase n=1 Tax=Anaeromyxobacter oryzae TaxID=2918170 RepID=UPI0020C03140|nr:GNAT family N-acetyltransferase [Anaeromyxobacter oryzae]
MPTTPASTDFTLRLADACDCAAICAVHVNSWKWAYRGLVADSALDALSAADRVPIWREALAPASAHRISLVERDGRAIGFAAWGPPRDADVGADTAELYALYLEREAAGTGAAHSLMVRARAEMCEHRYARAVLWVLAANPRARRFYEKEGWAVDGAEKTVNLRGTELQAVRYATAVR